mmetsp:Transcript_22522/g.42963  ORF Transcript_22522/g.42963 Transcript_22522/m.42963 type:complete len:489 (+) Transcript_22522:135-1601(+)
MSEEPPPAEEAPTQEQIEADPPEPEEPSAELEHFPGVQLSPIVVSIWFAEPKWKLLGEPEPKPPPVEGEEEEEEEAPPEEEPKEPEGPSKQMLFELVPQRVVDSSAMIELNRLHKKLLRMVAEHAELPKDMEEEERAAKQAELEAAKEEVAAAEARYGEVKGSFDPEPTSTLPWMNNLMDVAKAGAQTFVVGGAFWPCTDMMHLFTSKAHFSDCQKLMTLFKNRYDIERSRPISMFYKLVPNVFQECDDAPVDYNALLDDILKSTGQEPEAEEGAENPPKLDLVQLYWWDCEFGDYVKAAKTILGTKKTSALGLVNFPLKALKEMYRAGVDVATLEVNYPLGALERKEYTDVVDFCAVHNIKVMISNALLGGLLHTEQLGKLSCVGDGFREKIDSTGPLAEGKHRITEFGGWAKFQALLMCMDEIAKKHNTTLEVVALRYYLNKGVHPIIGIPWGSKCMERFPNLEKAKTEFLETMDMSALGAAFVPK